MVLRKVGRELILFLIVGACATLTHYLSGVLLVEVASFSAYSANTFGFLLSVFVSYFGHGIFTFQSRLSKKTFFRFAALIVFNYCVGQLVLYFCHDILHIHHRLSFAVLVVVLPITSYLLGKFWVFKP